MVNAVFLAIEWMNQFINILSHKVAVLLHIVKLLFVLRMLLFCDCVVYSSIRNFTIIAIIETVLCHSNTTE